MIRNIFRPATCAAILLMLTTASAVSAAAVKIELLRTTQCNLFAEGSPVKFDALITGAGDAQGTADAKITDFYGQVINRSLPIKTAAGSPTTVPLDLGVLEPGYYELLVTLKLKNADGKELSADSTIHVSRIENPGNKRVEDTDPFSFGVVRFVNRTAEEALKGGYRFGLKVWMVDDVWWRRTVQWNLHEAVDMSAKLGLQWTRQLLSQPDSNSVGMIGTKELLEKHAMNAVLKIEGWPAEFYDEKRYGTKEEWSKNHRGSKQWQRWSVPMKEPYQKWLREQIAQIPATQNVFEIGNEPWGQIPPEEWAEYCQMIVPVIRELRPDALIGTNLGQIEFDKQFFKAGGAKGMNMQTSHPYSFTPLPEHRIRATIRNYHDFLRAQTGQDVPIYVTEYGWPTAPKDSRGHSVSERVQAERTVRQSLMMYAEDIKALIPHWMADREYDRTDRENWFGFFRLSNMPKPVLIAHAVSARMIDGGRFVGDMPYGPGVGAMLFERGGVYTLAFWTLDKQARDVEAVVGGDQPVTAVDIMGREKSVISANGKLKLHISEDMTYLVGVNPSLAATAIPADRELDEDQWLIRDKSVPITSTSTPPMIDGNLDDWSGANPIEVISKGDADDSAKVYLKWDAEHVYIAMKVRDAKAVAPAAGKTIASGDHVQVSLSTRPVRQLGLYPIYDTMVRVAATSADGKPALEVSNAGWITPLANPSQDASGVRWAVVPSKEGWSGEVAIPFKLLDPSFRPVMGKRMSGLVGVVHVDKNGKPVTVTNVEAKAARDWPYLVLSK
jgi:hypothetical protein